MFLVIIGSLSYSIFMADSMYKKYNATIKWENSSLLSNIHQVPPQLAQNYISTEEQKVFKILTDVNIALEEIKLAGEVSEEKYNEYWLLYEKSKKGLEESDLYESMENKDIFNDFSLYLKADLAIKESYKDLNVEILDEYSKTFANRLAKEDSKIEKSFLNQLNEISKDLEELNEFSSYAVSKLGVVEEDTLYVDKLVNKTITAELIEDIKEKDLTRFSHIKNLFDILNGDSWNQIVDHNASSLEYYAWKESQEILDSLLHSNYISVSSFKTVQDVLSYQPSISLEEKKNFTINRDSIVTGVYYNGEKMDENLYVKRGIPLNFAINYQYTENPKSTVNIEYLDTDGNELSVDSYENYVGSSITIDRREIDGYILVEIKNNLNEFPKDDTVVQLIYELEPEPEPEPEPEEEETEEEVDPEDGAEEEQDAEEDPKESEATEEDTENPENTEE